MKNKKILFLFSIIMMFFCALNEVRAVGNVDYDVDSNGDGLDTSGSSDYCSVAEGCVHNEIGIRVTLVNDEGIIIKGTHYMDFWNVIPVNARGKTGSTYRSDYINRGGVPLPGSFDKEKGRYALGNVTSDLSTIGGIISYEMQHALIEDKIKEELNSGKNSGSCIVPELFNLLGYDDFCNDVINDNECEEKLSKTYILVEPMYYVNYKKKNVALTGTELAALIYHTRIILGDNISTKYLNRSAFDNAITNMYLTEKDAQYDFKSNGQIYKKFDDYASELQNINIIDYWNLGEENKNVIKAAIGKKTSLSPLGNSMHLVWLGTLAKDYCGPEECCIPCDPTDIECKTAAGENFHADDPYCCSETGLIKDFAEVDPETGEKGVCIDSDIYWNKEENVEIFEKYCMPNDDPPTPNECPNFTIDGEEIIDNCDEENEENISYFRDGVFNSKTGQFKNINTYEDLVAADLRSITEEIATGEIATGELGINTFKGVASTNSSEYSEKINDYCSLHCQEIFQVNLPDNYPSVNAGQYFTWTIDDTDNIVVASAVKLCAVDVDLDKAVDDYLDLSDDVEKAVYNAATHKCKGKNDPIVFPDTEIIDVEKYKAHYINENCYGLNENVMYVDSYEEQGKDGHCIFFEECTPGTIGCNLGENGWYKEVEYPCYHPTSDPYDFKDALERLFLGKQVTEYSGPKVCKVAPTPIGPDLVTVSSPVKGDRKTESYGDLTRSSYFSRLQGDYRSFVELDSTIYNINSALTECKKTGELLVDMGVQIEYQTLFEEKKYSEENNSIVVTDTDTEIKQDKGCYNTNGGKCDAFFAMNPASRTIYRNVGDSDSLVCAEEGESVVVNFWGLGDNAGEDNEYDPNKERQNNYNPTENVIMLDVSEYRSDDHSYVEGLKANLTKKWNTIYTSLLTDRQFFELAAEVNACVCKDGEVKNMENGECTCIKKVNYSEFPFEYNNYQVLDDGTLSVEFMNGPGLYPISLKYSNIGSLNSDGSGHFNTILDEKGKCEKGVCIYGDPNGVCRYVIKNKIIAYPDDECPDGDCNDICPDDDCSDICNENDCGEYDCIDSDGKPLDRCKNVTGLNVIYRVIDVADPFPGTDGNSRTPGANWCIDGDCETLVQDVITNANSSISSSTPLYSITMTPAVIKDIRTDNHTKMYGDYLKGTVIYPDGDSEDPIGHGESYFLHYVLPGIVGYDPYNDKYSINIEDKEWSR